MLRAFVQGTHKHGGHRTALSYLSYTWVVHAGCVAPTSRRRHLVKRLTNERINYNACVGPPRAKRAHAKGKKRRRRSCGGEPPETRTVHRPMPPPSVAEHWVIGFGRRRPRLVKIGPTSPRTGRYRSTCCPNRQDLGNTPCNFVRPPPEITSGNSQTFVQQFRILRAAACDISKEFVGHLLWPPATRAADIFSVVPGLGKFRPPRDFTFEMCRGENDFHFRLTCSEQIRSVSARHAGKTS